MRIFNKIFEEKRLKGEKGEILILTLIFMLMGFLMIVPLLSFMSTGLKTGIKYNQKADTLYAADAGVEDAIWQIKYNHLPGTFSSYDPFDYNSMGWTYSLPQTGINDKPVSVNIKNIWMPQNVTTPTKTAANAIINSGKILVTGGAYGTSSFNIVLTYYPGANENPAIQSVGIWLPPGFSYKPGSSNLEADSHQLYFCVPNTPLQYKGGQVIIWNYTTAVAFNKFPDAKTTDNPMTTYIRFDYVPATVGARPDGVAWATTGGVDLNGDGISTGTHYTWDSDIRVFGITSTSGDTSVETYVAKSEMRKMGGAVDGNYFATGNTLMTGPSSGRNTYYTGVATVNAPSTQGGENGVPEDANISAAYLYWSAYRGDSGVTRPLGDDCSSLSNWTNGGGWSVINSTNFLGHYPGGADTTRDLTTASAFNMTTYSGSSYITALSWEQWVYNATQLPPLNPDTCGNFNNWSPASSNSAWTTYNSQKFQGHANTNPDLPLKNSLNLNGAAAGTVTISWDQSVSGSPSSGTDKLNYYFSADGITYTLIDNAFSVGFTSTTKSVTIPTSYLTSSFKIKFSLVGFSSSKYCYIDNIQVKMSSAPTYSANDALQFAISKDAGVTWSEYIQAFSGDQIGTSPYANQSIYQYVVPRDYLATSFKIKFHLIGFGNAGQYCGLDNIHINVMQPDTGIPFKIKVGSGTDRQVYFNGNGDPAIGTTELTSTRTQAVLAYYNNTNSSPTADGYAYSCYRDVTALVQDYAQQPVNGAINFNGHAQYTLVNSTSNHIGDTGTALSFAGWSLVLIYTSPDIQAHQLYLYDKFIGSGQNPDTGLNVDYDGDGIPGGTVKGFVVPQRIGTEVNAAKITCFVGEGDSSLSGDYFALNGTKLWDGTNTTAPSYDATNNPVPKPNSKADPENVWNGQSMIASNDGIDIDTLGLDPPNGQYITWDSEILKPGDTKADITLFTRTDYWFMSYMILSFRSETTTGGSLSYLIRG